jgi:Rrf2 family iron-sulfur cluster assembly transcriptional regulator
LSYLEQLFGKLRRSELVESVRGPGGGYCLARPANEINVAEIIKAVDEPIDATQCGGKENCRDEGRCMTHDLWSDLSTTIHDYLSNITLGELIEKQQKKLKRCADKPGILQDKRTSHISTH